MTCYHEKWVEWTELRAIRAGYAGLGRKVVFTNGVFDLFHVGHLYILHESKKLGDCLIVGVNSDLSAKQAKGTPPIIPESERATILASLECVNYVTLFYDPTPLTLIQYLMPDILAKGSDWKFTQIIGGQDVIKGGGRVERIRRWEGKSTTEIIARIRKGV